MSFASKFLMTALFIPAFAASASAQAPQTEKNVSMKMALMIIEGTLEQCTKDGYKVSIVIVDKAGNVAASLRGDGTNPHTMEFGRLKAYTARTRGQTSQEFKTLTDKPESAYLKQIPNVVAVGGGVPIKVGNEVIGAVGVSGAPGGEKDEACAMAGIAKVAGSLQ
ncbi:MAG TPA: heme-binding protein [Hyphomicrobiaceae bacterium]|nr:heme-binding protein [Hyphomicrobiaceae bacterium]